MKTVMLLLILISCSYHTGVYRIIDRAGAIVFVCRKTVPFYSFGKKELRMEFYGPDAEQKAIAKCDSLKD